MKLRKDGIEDMPNPGCVGSGASRRRTSSAATTVQLSIAAICMLVVTKDEGGARASYLGGSPVQASIPERSTRIARSAMSEECKSLASDFVDIASPGMQGQGHRRRNSLIAYEVGSCGGN